MRPENVVYDLAVIGGGINGSGIACDAAGRGLKTLLVESGDLGSATSSASSKLIHGGLRYLEQGAIRLVRESLIEREILLAKAPHIVRPLKFILPHDQFMRPRWMIRLGLFLYDHLSRRRTLPASSSVDLTEGPKESSLKSEYRRGFSYWDCWVDDARLVVLNARAAADSGAVIKTQTHFIDARIEGNLWRLIVEDRPNRSREEVRARAVVNAAGPWAGEILAKFERPPSARSNAGRPKVRRIKGSHIVVPDMSRGEAYILQNIDRRVVFVLPFESRFSLIGTTDIPFESDVRTVAIDQEEIDYLLAAVNRVFQDPVKKEDIVWAFAGVRPLFDDDVQTPSRVTRDYRLVLDADPPTPPLLSVIGGKITTYRAVAEEVMARLAPWFPGMGPPWTADVPLPGGDIESGDFDWFFESLMDAYPALDSQLVRAIARRHGTLAPQILGDAKGMGDLGHDYGGGLFEREVDHLKRHEWARQPADVLWRRTKAGLHMTANQLAQAEEMLTRVL